EVVARPQVELAVGIALDLAAAREDPGIQHVPTVQRPAQQEEAVVAGEQRAAGIVQPADVRQIPLERPAEVEARQLADDRFGEPGVRAGEVAAAAQLVISHRPPSPVPSAARLPGTAASAASVAGSRTGTSTSSG